jgi:predicted PurR-regulated permease PerM
MEMNEQTQGLGASQVLLTMAAFIIVVAGMRAAVNILVPCLLAAFIAIISTSPLFWLQKKGLPGWFALLIVIGGIFLIGFLVALLVGSSVQDFTAALPLYEEKLRQQTALTIDWLNKLGIDTSELALTEILNPASVMKLVALSLNSLGGVLANGFLILMTVIFMLLEATSIPAKLTLILGHQRSSMQPYENFISNVKNYMAIKTLVSFATGILVAIWIFIMGVDYPLLWGVLAFALNYVPNIGSIIAAVPAVLLAIVQVGFLEAAVVAIGYGAINIGIGSVVEPRFMGRGLGLSTLVVFLSLLFWGWVLGPVGMLLSVPLTITAKIALDSSADSRWLAVLLGPELVSEQELEYIED